MLCALPFGKYKKTKCAIHHFTSKRKASPKAALLRHRKDIEEENDGYVLEQIEQASEQPRCRWRMQPFSQQLAIYGDGHPGAKLSWQRQQNQRVVHHCYMV